MIETFGPRAQSYARRLTGIEHALICDAEQLGAGCRAAVARRATGVPFYGMILLEDARSRIILQNIQQVCDWFPDPDVRRLGVEQFCNGGLKLANFTLSSELWSKPDELLNGVAGEFYAFCDAMLVRSHAELQRVAQMVKRLRPFDVVVVEPVLPNVERVAPPAPSVVVWAPERASRHVMLYALSLMEFLGEVTFVTGDGEALAGYPGRYMRIEGDIADVLARASCIVCTNADDPGAAVAFGRTGIGIAAPITSGAHEFVRDVVTFDLANFRSIFTAVQIAIAQATSLRALPVPPAVPSRPQLPPAATLPLASIIVMTYNRPEDLARALTCLEAQTYPNLEVVVVNDAGQDVSDVVTRFSRARLVNQPVNGGVNKAVVRGLGEIRGAYAGILSDDDWFEPDHVEGLVGAMMRSGGQVAHGNTVIRFQDLIPGAEPVTTGLNSQVFNESVTPTDALITTSIAGHAVMFRVDALDVMGLWREDTFLADQEFQMRAANNFVLVYLDRITAEWRIRGTDNFSTKTDSSGELRRIYDEYHPMPHRPFLEQRRDDTVANVAKRVPGEFAFPPTIQFKAGA